MSKLNETAFASLAARDSKTPVVMLNLLKFNEGGAARYAEYGVAVAPLLAKVGGRVRFQGAAAELVIGDEVWDLVLLVEYPSRSAFISMVTSLDYQKIVHLRDEALERSVLCATDPVTL